MQMSRLIVWSTAFSDDERSETKYRLSADETPLTLSGLPPENRDNSRDNIRTKHFINAKIHIFTQLSKRNQHRNRSGLQAALSGLAGPHKRTDPRLECSGQHRSGQVCSRHQVQDLRCEPLHEAQLLGRVLRWPNHDRRAYTKAAAFDDPATPVATAIDIKAKYDAKCGTPSAGSPKVFFKYFFVNTVTGEKSGDVLAQAKLTNE